jgi:hypothetical protein
VEFRDRLIQFIRDRLQKSSFCSRALHAALNSLSTGNRRPRRVHPYLSRTVDLAESRLLLSGASIVGTDGSANLIQPDQSSAGPENDARQDEVNPPEDPAPLVILSQVISGESKHDSPQVARTGVPSNQTLPDSSGPDLSFGSEWPDFSASGQVAFPDVDAVFTDRVFDLLDSPFTEIGGINTASGAKTPTGPLSSDLMGASDELAGAKAGTQPVAPGVPEVAGAGPSAQQSRSSLMTGLPGQNVSGTTVGGLSGATASDVASPGNMVTDTTQSGLRNTSYILPHQRMATDVPSAGQPSSPYDSISTSWMARWFGRYSGAASHWFRRATSSSFLKFRKLGSESVASESASIAARRSAFLGLSQPAELHPQQDSGSHALSSVSHPLLSPGQPAEAVRAYHHRALHPGRTGASVPSESRTLTEESATANRKQKLGDRQPQSLRKGLEASVELAPELPPIPDSGAGPRILRYSINARAPPNHPQTPTLIQLNRDVRAEQLERLRHSIAPRGPSLVSAETLHQVSSSVSGPKLSRNI